MNLNELLEAARKLGKEHGEAAASWVFDGNTDTATYDRWYKGLEDGDPEIVDQLPHSPLSGEFADDMSPTRLYVELGVTESQLHDWEQNSEPDDICEAYEDAFLEASQNRVAVIARDNSSLTNYGAW